MKCKLVRKQLKWYDIKLKLVMWFLENLGIKVYETNTGIKIEHTNEYPDLMNVIYKRVTDEFKKHGDGVKITKFRYVSYFYGTG